MRTENGVQAQQRDLEKGRRLVFNQESSLTPSSSRSSSSSSDGSYSSSDRSRSPSVSRRPRRHHRHGSRYSSSSSRSSRSRSRPRCCRTSDRSFYRCRHRSRSYSPYPRCSSRYGRRRYSRSISRSSSRESYYRRPRRSRSRSSSYRRRRGAYVGRFRCQFSPSPMRRYYRYKSKSPECSIRLSQKDKMDLLNVARENAAKILGVEVVKLPASVRCVEEQVEKTLKSDPEKRVRADCVEEQVEKTLKSDPEKGVRADPVLLKKPPQDEGEADEDMGISRTSPGRKPIAFSIRNVVAKPSDSPTLHVTKSKVTSRADIVGNRKPYGRWIPVKTVSIKKR